MWGRTAAAGGLFAFHLSLATLIDYFCPHSYMSMRWIEGDFYHDPMITSFPGLYLLSIPYFKISEIIFPESSELFVLRIFNSIIAQIIFWACHHILSCKGVVSPFTEVKSLYFSILPLLFPYFGMCYTDIGATAFMLLAFGFLYSQRFTLCGFASIIALSFRQTNIVWIGFIIVESLVRKFSDEQLRHNTKCEKLKNSPGSDPTPHYIKELYLFTIYCIKYVYYNPLEFSKRYFLLFCLLVFFAVFVVINGSITLGDHSAHNPVLHLFQMELFTLVISIMYLFDMVVAVIKTSRNITPKILFRVLFASLFGYVAFTYYRYEHIYNLSDNRHYSFYILKMIQKHKSIQYLLHLNCGITLGWLIPELLATPPLWTTFFFFFSAVVLVPANLVDFRYFIFPILLLGLNFHVRRDISLQLMKLAYFTLFNVALLILFVFPYATYSDGELIHFMW